MKAVLVNYNFTPDWLKDSGLDYLLIDRSDSKEYLKDFPQERIIYTENVGNIDYDKLSFLVEQYDNLPAVFVWGKSNLLKYVDQNDLKSAIQQAKFAPLLKYDHKTYKDRNGDVCYYKDGMYYERNDSWYLNSEPAKYVNNFHQWAIELGIDSPKYIPFPPGGNFILTKERVHRYSRDLYDKMRQMMPYTTLPGEAHLAERTYYLLWQ